MSASNPIHRCSLPFIAAIAFVVFGVMNGTIAAQAANDPQPALAPSQNEVKIVSTEFKFAIPAQRIVAGQPVTLVLDNSQAESEHAVFFQALGVRVFAQAGEIVRKTIIFDKAGEFAFVCDLPGHREAGMIGKLTVHEEDIGNKNEYPIILGVSN
jgi:plastocyanin